MRKLNFKKIIIKLIYIIVLMYVVITLIQQQQKINSHEATIANLNEEINKSNEYKTELMATKENINSIDYIERVAREKLNMYMPNEKVYVDIGN